jgi:hypothetical protein
MACWKVKVRKCQFRWRHERRPTPAPPPLTPTTRQNNKRKKRSSGQRGSYRGSADVKKKERRAICIGAESWTPLPSLYRPFPWPFHVAAYKSHSPVSGNSSRGRREGQRIRIYGGLVRGVERSLCPRRGRLVFQSV